MGRTMSGLLALVAFLILSAGDVFPLDPAGVAGWRGNWKVLFSDPRILSHLRVVRCQPGWMEGEGADCEEKMEGIADFDPDDATVSVESSWSCVIDPKLVSCPNGTSVAIGVYGYGCTTTSSGNRPYGECVPGFLKYTGQKNSPACDARYSFCCIHEDPCRRASSMPGFYPMRPNSEGEVCCASWGD